MDWVEIPLTQDMVALVDVADASDIQRHRWCVKQCGWIWYAVRNISIGTIRTQLLMHRVILNVSSGVTVDHKNRNGLDNRRENLRLSNHSDNGANRKLQANNTSGFVGVYWDKRKQKWGAYIRQYGKQKQLGRYLTAEEAACRRDEETRKLFGITGRYNFPLPGEQGINE